MAYANRAATIVATPARMPVTGFFAAVVSSGVKSDSKIANTTSRNASRAPSGRNQRGGPERTGDAGAVSLLIVSSSVTCGNVPRRQEEH